MVLVIGVDNGLPLGAKLFIKPMVFTYWLMNIEVKDNWKKFIDKGGSIIISISVYWIGLFFGSDNSLSLIRPQAIMEPVMTKR